MMFHQSNQSYQQLLCQKCTFCEKCFPPNISHTIGAQLLLVSYYITVAFSLALVFNIRNTSLAAPGALIHQLQHRTVCTIQNGHQGAPIWPTESGKGSNQVVGRSE